jgi:hypothetical protein
MLGCEAKSLIAYALTRFGVAQIARPLRFPSVLLQPLGHLSVSFSTGCGRVDVRLAQDETSETVVGLHVQRLAPAPRIVDNGSSVENVAVQETAAQCDRQPDGSINEVGCRLSHLE